MPDEELDAMKILQEVANDAFTARCEWKALVQMLIDRKILKGNEDEILDELANRAADIKFADLREARINQRAHEISEAWSKLPKQ